MRKTNRCAVPPDSLIHAHFHLYAYPNNLDLCVYSNTTSSCLLCSLCWFYSVSPAGVLGHPPHRPKSCLGDCPDLNFLPGVCNLHYTKNQVVTFHYISWSQLGLTDLCNFFLFMHFEYCFWCKLITFINHDWFYLLLIYSSVFYV